MEMQRPAKPKQTEGESDLVFHKRLAEWRDGDRAYMREYHRAREARDPAYLENHRERSRAWKSKNKEAISQYRSEYFAANKAKEIENGKRWIANNPTRKAEHEKTYRAKHAEKIKQKASSPEALAKRRARDAVRYNSDAGFRIEKSLRASLNQALRLQGASKRERVLDLIGCTIPELMKHLEEQFQAGMSWKNRTRDGWHVDHRKPCCSFDLTDVEQQRACFHYTNLQPLWGPENQSKGGKLEWTAA